MSTKDKGKRTEVRINEERLTLDFVSPEGRVFYYVPLERVTNSESALDWIMQVARKRWATDRILGTFVKAMDAAVEARYGKPIQGVLCSLAMGGAAGQPIPEPWRKP